MSKKRNRRSAQDRRPQLLRMRNTFLGWHHAVNAKITEDLYSDLEDIPDKSYIIDNYPELFWEIPNERFYDEKTIKVYGENLKKCREEKQWTLEEAADIFDIHLQALQQIEAGERKKINQTLLLLFCGVYQTPPEELIGLDTQKKVYPMVFYPENVSKKAKYVIDRLMYQDVDLLELFAYFSRMPIPIRKKLTTFLNASPLIPILTDKGMDIVLEKFSGIKTPNAGDETFVVYRYFSNYCEKLCDMGIETPDLLNVYVSIAAAGAKVWEPVLQLVLLAGFVPFPETDAVDLHE